MIWIAMLFASKAFDNAKIVSKLRYNTSSKIKSSPDPENLLLCPQAKALEMGRGGLMIPDNETIKGENEQIVRGGDLSAPEVEGRGFVRMSAVIFSSFLSARLIGKGGQVR